MPDEINRRPEDTSGSEVIPLGKTATLSLEGLSEAQRAEIRMEHAKTMVRLKVKAEELAIEAQALGARLNNMGDAAADANRNDIAITLTSTQTDSLGRTEVIIGNTETAAKGKLNRSQAGQKDLTLVYIVVAAIVAIIIALILKQ
jgi:hypothetical protein